MNRVLIIVRDFPPCGGGGVIRTLKFVKYLPSFGWMPVILTVHESYYDPAMVDNSWLGEIPEGVEIVRTRCLRPRKGSYSTGQPSGYNETEHPAWRLAKRVKDGLTGKLVVRQDDAFLWYPYAIPAIHKLAKTGNIDLVFSSSPPHAVQLLGLMAKRILRKPWVVDFRDGWVDDPLYRAGYGVRRALDRSFERRVVENADMVISATDTIDRWLRDRYGRIRAEKHTVITNGFDPEDFVPDEVPERDRNGAMQIVYTGALGGLRSGIPFLQALSAALSGGNVPPGGIRVEFCGNIDADTRALASRLPGVTMSRLVPHDAAIAKMLSADVLLLVGSQESPDALTGKLFEYIAARRPILALTPDGALAQLIARESIGMVAPVDDIDAIRDALIGLYRKHVRGQLELHHRSNDRLLASCDRRQQTQRLVSIFDGLLA